MAKRSSLGPLMLSLVAASCTLYVACGDDEIIVEPPPMMTGGSGGTGAGQAGMAGMAGTAGMGESGSAGMGGSAGEAGSGGSLPDAGIDAGYIDDAGLYDAGDDAATSNAG